MAGLAQRVWEHDRVAGCGEAEDLHRHSPKNRWAPSLDNDIRRDYLLGVARLGGRVGQSRVHHVAGLWGSAFSACLRTELMWDLALLEDVEEGRGITTVLGDRLDPAPMARHPDEDEAEEEDEEFEDEDLDEDDDDDFDEEDLDEEDLDEEDLDEEDLDEELEEEEIDDIDIDEDDDIDDDDEDFDDLDEDEEEDIEDI